MVKVNVKRDGQNYELNIPSGLKDIDVEYLKDLAGDIEVADHHALIAIVTRTTLSEAILSVTKKKESMVGVIPVFIKGGRCDSEYVKKINIGDVLVVGAGDIENAHHINLPLNNLSKDKILGLIMNDETPSGTGKTSKAHMDNMVNSSPVCFVSFKIVPACNIVGYYPKDVKHNNTLVNQYIAKKSIMLD